MNSQAHKTFEISFVTVHNNFKSTREVIRLKVELRTHFPFT